MAARVIVIGAGPAGVRAAQALVEAGLRPLVIDEGRRDGGQIYRRQPDGFRRTYAALYGTEAARAQHLHNCFDALRAHIDYLPETLVWNIRGGVVHLTNAQGASSLAFDALLVCTGATDRLMPVPGWQYAGTYSLGGAQVALKSQGCVIGSQTVMLGTGPLLYLLAAQYVKAGVKPAAVLDTSPAHARFRALPQLLAKPAVLLKGAALLHTLRTAGVPIHRGVTPIRIDGDDELGVRGVHVKLADDSALAVPADAVAMGFHLRPETQIADLAGCAFTFDDAAAQWLPAIDENGRSSVPGIYLAGDGARVRGADAAECAGRLAALAALRELGIPPRHDDSHRLRARLARLSRFASGLRTAFPWPAHHARQLPDTAVVCRCEGITAGELRRVCTEQGAMEANRAKAFSRVGMGRCQGRFCAHAGTEVMAAALGVPLAAVGRLRGQAPVKPLAVALDAAAQAKDTEATRDAAASATPYGTELV
ncbi:FAD-dependent oxidoreductase [Pandoraea sp.]|uniref:FAD/NAD(P)-dependent oxidoreductase n=1 Tax=Pandoraea sp. TaxID=1883445 RepID=UPI0035B0BC35